MNSQKGLTTGQFLIALVVLISLPFFVYKMVRLIELEDRPSKISKFRKKVIESWDFNFGMRNKQKQKIEGQVDELKEQIHLLSKRLCLLAKKTDQKIVECQRYDAILKTDDYVNQRKRFKSCASELDFAIYKGEGVCLESPLPTTVTDCLGGKLKNIEPGNIVVKLDGEHYCLQYKSGIKKFVAKRIYTGTCYHVCKRRGSVCIGEVKHKGLLVPACIIENVTVSCSNPFQAIRELVCEQDYEPAEGAVYFTRKLLDESKVF
jgi:hypothetical protein